MSATIAPTLSTKAPARMKLTRRGRFVLFGLPVLLVLGALMMMLGAFLNPAQASTGGLSTTETVSVSVKSGESLWSVAERVSPDRDPREVVAEIAQINNLESSTLLAGQKLEVPAP